MNLFIGTLYSQENEYDECVLSIQKQTYRNYEHFVFRNLANKDAHNTLFRSFLEKLDKFDTLVKVDADLVLNKDDLFDRIVRVLQANPSIKILSIAVHDFFSNQLIYGLNAYRNSVRWSLENENLFVDIPDTPIEEYFFDNKEMAPAAEHCPNPSAYQAFHFGVHRALKVIQPGRLEKKESSSRTHWNILERTWQNFLSTRDRRIGLASLGAEQALSGRFNIDDINHENPRMHQELEKFQTMSVERLYRQIKMARFFNWGFMPSSRRRKIICKMHSVGIRNFIRF